jgi:alpha-beta hydrolase superfamily lysophospholipase
VSSHKPETVSETSRPASEETRAAIPVDGIALSAVLHEPAGVPRWPAVVAAHGLLSSKASDKYLRLAAALPQHGIALCRFDFRGCGESGGALADATLSAWLRDLQAVIAWVRARGAFDGGLGLMGSSMGGFLSVCAAAADRGVGATVTWATPVALHDLAARQDVVRESGLGEPFLAELRSGRMLEVPEGVANILIIHGDGDDVVPVKHAHVLWERAADPKRLEILAGADHRILDPAHRDRAVALTVAWCRAHLGVAP